MGRTGLFIQVRLGSTRLPGKALLPLAGVPVVSHVMRAVAQVPAEVHALLTDAASAEGLSSPAKQEGYRLFVGSPDDVLARFCAACREYDVDRVVRVTGDNPLTSGLLAIQILEQHARRSADLSHYLDIPWGMGVEAVQTAALLAAEREAVDPAEREHITTYHYRHREKFLIIEAQPPADARMPEGRVTVDTPADFTRVQRLFADLYEGRPLEHDRVVRWLAAERSGSGAR